MKYKLIRILQHKYTFVIGLFIILSFYFGFTLVNAEVKKPVNPYDNKEFETSNVVLRDGIEIVFEDKGDSEIIQPELNLEPDSKPEEPEETPEEPEEPEEVPEEPEELEETPEEPEEPEEAPEEPEEPEEAPEEPEEPEETPEEPEEPEEIPEEPEEPEESPEEPEEPEESPEEPEEPEETPEEPEEPEETPEEPEEPEESPEEPEEPEETPEEPEEPEETPEEPEEPEETPEEPEEPEETPEEPEETPEEPEKNPGGEGGNNSGEEGTDPEGEGGNNSGEEGTDPEGEGGNNSGEEGTDPEGEGGNNSGEEGTDPEGEGGNNSGEEDTDPEGEGGNNSGEEGTDPEGEGGNNSGEEGTDPEGEGGNEPTPPLEPKPPVNDDYLGVYLKEEHIQVKQGDHLTGISNKEITLSMNKQGEHFAYQDFITYIKYIEETYDIKENNDFFVKYKVTLNGKVISNSVEQQIKLGLRNGVNRVKVELLLEDKAGNPVGDSYIHNTKTFSISVKDEKDIIIYTDLKDNTTVYGEELAFNAYARDHGKKLPQNEVEVKVNGVKTNPISSRTSEYKVMLSRGENEIVIRAGDKEATFIYTYDEYWFDLKYLHHYEIDAPGDQVGKNYSYSYRIDKQGDHNDQIEIITDENDKLKPRLERYNSTGRLLGNDEIEMKITQGRVEIDQIEPKGISLLTLTARNKVTNEIQTRTFIVHDQHQTKGQDGRLFIRNNSKLYEEKEMVTQNKQVNLILSAFDFLGDEIEPERIKVYHENRLIHAEKFDQQSAYYSIGKGLGLAHGENRIRIEFTDKLGYTTSNSYKIHYEEPEIGDVIGQAEFHLEAGALGLGNLAESKKMDIIHGETGAELLDRYLKENGFTYAQTGNHQADFYLSYLKREDLPGTVNPPEDLLDVLAEEGIYFDKDNYANGQLGEFDFTAFSGWMYSVNGAYVNLGFSEYQFQDGDQVRIRFTLALGADIGAKSNNPDYPFPNLGDW